MASSRRYVAINRETGLMMRWNGTYTTKQFNEVHRWRDFELLKFLNAHPDRDQIDIVLFEE